MRRSTTLLLTLLLALTTAFALLRAEALLRLPAVESAATGVAENEAIVRRFYAIANEAIRTGDPAPLAALVAADLIDDGPLGDHGSGRAGLAARLAALHETAPSLVLTVAELAVDADRVVARVSEADRSYRTFLGAPIHADDAAPWGTIDVFRIESGLIVERWSIGDRLGDLQPLLQAPLADPPATAVVVGLARFTYAPGAVSLRHVDPGPLVVAVEAGELAVATEGPAMVARAGAVGVWAAVAPGVDLRLRTGDQLQLPTETKRAFANPGLVSAVFLAVIVAPAAAVAASTGGPTVYWDFQWPIRTWPGIAAEPLAGGIVDQLADQAGVIAVGRASLAPGSSLSPHPAALPELVYVEAGTAGLSMSSRRVTVRYASGADEPASGDAELSLASGDGAFLPPVTVSTANAVTLRNAGADPLTLLIVRVLPAAA